MTPTSKIPLTLVDVGQRIRREYGDLPALMASIREKGLIQPIVLNQDNKLIAGGRRFFSYAALVELGDMTYSEIPCVYLETLDEAHLRELELEENLQRADMTWQEYCFGVLEIHNLKKATSFAAGQSWDQSSTALTIGRSRQRVSQILTIARCLQDPRSPVHNATSIDTALLIIIQSAEDAAKAQLALLSVGQGVPMQVSAPGKPLSPKDASAGTIITAEQMMKKFGLETSANQDGATRVETSTTATGQERLKLTVDLGDFFYHGNCVEWLKQNAGKFDHIITDPPYAIDMENLQQDSKEFNVEKTIDEHQVNENLGLLKAFIPAAFEAMKDRGFMVLFCDFMNFRMLHDLGIAAGFAVQRWPVIWCKTQGKNESHQYNFTKASEAAIVMRKKTSQLRTHQSLNWRVISPGPLDKDFDHPFAKPNDLWQWMIEAVSDKNEMVFDAFAGSGSGVCPLIRTGRQWRACEKADQHVMEFLRNVSKCYHEHFLTLKADVSLIYSPKQLTLETPIIHATSNQP